MSKVKIEAFLSVPICAGGALTKRHLERLGREYGDEVEIITHQAGVARWIYRTLSLSLHW